MKIKQPLAAIAAAFAIVCCLNSTLRADEEVDRASLRLILTNYMEAVNSGEVSKLAPYVNKDVTGVMVTGEEVQGLEGLQLYWKKIQDLIGPGGKYHVTVNVDKTDFYADVALSRGNTADVVRLGNGKELRFSSFWTAICHKQDGAWKVVRMEATMNPVDNVFVSLRLLKVKLVYAVCGAVAGAILAWAILFLMSREKREHAKAG